MKKIILTIFILFSVPLSIFADDSVIVVGGNTSGPDGTGNLYGACTEEVQDSCSFGNYTCEGGNCVVINGVLTGNKITFSNGTVCDGNCKVENGILTGDKISILHGDSGNTVCDANGGMCSYDAGLKILTASGGAITVTTITKSDGSTISVIGDSSNGGTVEIDSDGNIIATGGSTTITTITKSDGTVISIIKCDSGDEGVCSVIGNTGENSTSGDGTITNVNSVNSDNIDDNIDNEANNEEETTNIETLNCPTSFIKKYETLLLKSKIYKNFTESITEINLEPLFKTGSDISNFTKIKDGIFNKKLNNISFEDSFKNLFTQGEVKQDLIDNEYNYYLKQSPEADFILHDKMYSESENLNTIQNYVINGLKNQINQGGNIDILENILNKNNSELFIDLIPDDEKKNFLIKNNSEIIFKPFKDFLEKKKKEKIQEIVGKCKFNGENIECGEISTESEEGMENTKKINIGEIKNLTEELIKLEVNYYMIDNISDANKLTNEGISGQDGSYPDLVNSIKNSFWEDFDDIGGKSVIQSKNQYYEICGQEKSLKSCKKDLLNSFMENNFAPGMREVSKTINFIDPIKLYEKINIQNLINEMKGSYDDLVKNDVFLNTFESEFGSVGIKISKNENGDNVAAYPSGYLDIIGNGSCDNTNNMSALLSDFIALNQSNIDMLGIDDFSESILLEGVSNNDINLEDLEDVIESSSTDIEIDLGGFEYIAAVVNGGDCPFLYKEDEDGNIDHIGTILAGKIIKNLKGNSFDQLERSFNKDKNIKFSIAEILPETLHLDYLKGKIFKHHKNQEIFMDQKGNFFPIKKDFWKKKYSFDKKINGNFTEINLGKINKENLILFKGGIDSEKKGHKVVGKFLLGGFISQKINPFHGIFSKIFYGIVENTNISKKFISTIEDFDLIKFQYLENGNWINFEETGTYQQEMRIVEIPKSLKGKEIRIKYYSNMNTIEELYLQNKYEIGNIENKEIFPEEEISNLSKIDGLNFIIKQGENLNLNFDINGKEIFGEDKKEDERYTLYLKTNGFYRFLEK